MKLRALSLAALLGLGGCQEDAGPGPGSLPPSVKETEPTTPWRPGEPAGPGEVRLKIVAPLEAAILKNSTVPEIKVEASSVVPGGSEASRDPIDPTSLTYALHRPGEAKPIATGALTGPFSGAFVGRLDLSAAESGDHALLIAAKTVGGRTGSATVMVRVDAGPALTVLSPRDGQSYRGSLSVAVVVDPSPFGPASEIVASVAGKQIALKPSSTPNGLEGLLELASQEPPLEDEQVFRLVAKNAQGTQTIKQVRFRVDQDGPVIESTEPKEGEVVGGVIRVRAKLRDPAGVLGPSVTAVIGHKADANFQLELEPEDPGSGVYSAIFDTRKLTSCKPRPDNSLCVVMPNLSFRATDRLGNESSLAYEIGVDNHPPVLDLDPARMRMLKYDEGRPVCSWSFDPLGDYAGIGNTPNDRCAVPQVFDVSALIEDVGHYADGLRDPPTAGVDEKTTRSYILDDTSQPLVVDVDGDGICDAINPLLVPTTTPPTRSGQLLEHKMVGLKPAGAADFTRDPSLVAGDPAFPGCPVGKDPVPPQPLCLSPWRTVIVPSDEGLWAKQPETPAVWSVEPVASCSGQVDSYANEVAEGWLCVAAAAADRAGNGSVSPPLRLWLQRRGLSSNGSACPSPPASAGAAPDCTGTYDPKTNTVTAKPCQARRWDKPRLKVVLDRP